MNTRNIRLTTNILAGLSFALAAGTARAQTPRTLHGRHLADLR